MVSINIEAMGLLLMEIAGRQRSHMSLCLKLLKNKKVIQHFYFVGILRLLGGFLSTSFNYYKIFSLLYMINFRDRIDGLAVTHIYCSCRGPEYDCNHHVTQLIATYKFYSKGILSLCFLENLSSCV